MRLGKFVYGVGLCLCMTACGPAGTNLRTVQLNDTDGTQKAVFQVELALDALAWQQGLMQRANLPTDQGMLFIFPTATPESFWMKNTLIPLDIIFFDSNGRLINFKTAQPCQQDPCATYPSEAAAQSVLEINAGLATQLGLEAGDQLILK